MIDKLNNYSDIDILMTIWLEKNKSAHSFISEKYWNNTFSPKADYTREQSIVTILRMLEYAGEGC